MAFEALEKWAAIYNCNTYCYLVDKEEYDPVVFKLDQCVISRELLVWRADYGFISRLNVIK